MGWCMTSDLDRFLAVAGGYLRSKAAENTLLLSAAQAAQAARTAQAAEAAQAARAGQDGQDAQHGQAAPQSQAAQRDPGLLFGWWDPPDGSGPRGAFLHDQAAPVLMTGRAPETAAALAAALSRTGRWVTGVDAPTGAADAFAAAWSQRAGVPVRVHSRSRVYRLAGPAQDRTGADQPGPDQMGPAGRYRVATWSDRALLVSWLTAFGTEVGELSGAPEAAADDLLAYGGAAFWEAEERPVAMAATTRPVVGTVRISTVYTPPERRHNGYATAVMRAATYAALSGQGGAGQVNEVVLITDTNSPDRQASRLGYQLIGERVVLRFGPPTGPMPRLQTGPMQRVQTGPMQRVQTGPRPRIQTGPQPRLEG
jgi:Acetyltransferase (GNAT) family